MPHDNISTNTLSHESLSVFKQTVSLLINIFFSRSYAALFHILAFGTSTLEVISTKISHSFLRAYEKKKIYSAPHFGIASKAKRRKAISCFNLQRKEKRKNINCTFCKKLSDFVDLRQCHQISLLHVGKNRFENRTRVKNKIKICLLSEEKEKIIFFDVEKKFCCCFFVMILKSQSNCFCVSKEEIEA